MNLNEKNTSMLNLRKGETYKKKKLFQVLIFLAFCLISQSHCSIFILTPPAHLLDTEVAAIYFMIAT